MNVEGRCHCGKIRYQARVNPDWAFICHCADCQALAGSAFRVGVPVADDSFTLTADQPKKYIFAVDSGVQRVRAFCPDCGTPIYAADANDLRWLAVPVSTTGRQNELPPKMQIWCQSALPWITHMQEIEGMAKQPAMPR